MNSKLLEGKVALITGGSRGIGRAIALCFADNGADVIITSHRITDETLATVEELKSKGVNAEVIDANINDYNLSAEAVQAVAGKYGRIDILVNNAGITKDGLTMRMSEEDWDSVINVDLKSAFNMIHAVLPVMLKQKSGSIVNISSIVGKVGNIGQSNYCAAKAGLIGLAKSVAKEMGGKGIRCNCIAPGFIKTGMTENLPDAIYEDWGRRIALRRPGNPEEVAKVALFLASDLSSYVTAQVINCCGGIDS